MNSKQFEGGFDSYNPIIYMSGKLNALQIAEGGSAKFESY